MLPKKLPPGRSAMVVLGPLDFSKPEFSISLNSVSSRRLPPPLEQIAASVRPAPGRCEGPNVTGPLLLCQHPWKNIFLRVGLGPFQGGRPGSNRRPPGPQPGALTD